MIIWLVLITLSAFSQDQAIEEYCFSTPSRMKEVQRRLRFILVPIDQVQENNNCFTVNTAPHRRELIQSYVHKLEPSVQISYSSAAIRRDPCRIKVEKVRTLNQQTAGIDVAFENAGIDLNASSAVTSGAGSDVTTIQTIRDFELTVNQDVVKGECRAINPNRYEISLEVRKDARPLVPPVAAGTVLVVTEAQIPKDQETSRLQTSLQLNRGERMEIGSVVKNLKNGSGQVEIGQGAQAHNRQNTQSEKIFISLD